MATPTAPVELPGWVAESIDHALAEMAKDFGIEDIHWYHDAPIWLLRQREDPFVRRVQITAFQDKWRPARITLKLIPEWYKREGGQVSYRMEAKDVRARTISMDLDPWYASPERFSEELQNRLRAVWKTIRDYTAS